MFFDPIYLFGCVFDVYSINLDGSHTLSLIKDCLIKNIFIENANLKLYVSSSNNLNIAHTEGEITNQVDSYQQPLQIDLHSSYERCVEILSDYHEDCSKIIFLFTDRFNDKNQYHYEKCMIHPSLQQDSIKLIVFYLGQKANSELCKKICERHDAKFVYLNSKNVFKNIIKEIYVQS